jgi:predicted transcriptional regulator
MEVTCFMAMHNITLSLPKGLLRRIQILAVKRNTSVSALLTRMLEDLVSTEDAYDRARRRHLASLTRGSNLGTGGHATWTRDESHDR